MTKISLGHRIDADGPTVNSSPAVYIDVERLIEDRLLIQANSGGGKSWTVRRICEQVTGVQKIIIDPEGEYHTLREKDDYVLAGQRGGDCAATIASADLLARRLLELGTSAIIDIYELGLQRAQFVHLFFTAVMNAPKDLWHPVLFVIDETHLWAPEEGHAVSTRAICDLVGRGRKRGFGAVLATQRIAKVHKDAIAECNNVLVGRCNLDNDQKRAGKELGFTDRQQIRDLRKLGKGAFYAYGPAISDEVILVQVGGVTTTHPKSGMRAIPPPPPRATVKKILAQLADLPAEAAAEATTLNEYRLKLKLAEAEIEKLQKLQPKAETKIVEKTVITEAQIARIEKVVDKLMVLRQQETVVAGDVLSTMKEVSTGISLWRSAMLKPSEIPAVRREPIKQDFTLVPRVYGRNPASTKQAREDVRANRADEDSKLVIGMLRMLAVLKRDGALSRRAVALRSLMTPGGGTFKTYMPKLIREGYVDESNGGLVVINVQGEAVLREDRIILCPAPGDALVQSWSEELIGKERDILLYLHSIYPGGATRAEIAQACGMAVDGGTFKTYMPKILRKDLATQEGLIVTLARELMP